MLLKHKKCPNCGAYYDPTLEKCPGCHKHNELYLNREINDKIAFMHPATQIGLFLGGFSFAGMLIIQILVALLIRDAITDKTALDATMISCTYILMLGGLFFLIFFTRRKHFFSKYKRKIDYIYGLAYAITLIFVGALVGNVISLFYQVTDNANQSTAVIFSKNYPLLAFFVIGFLGPICEELTYRVGLYSFLRRINGGIILTVLVFFISIVGIIISLSFINDLLSKIIVCAVFSVLIVLSIFVLINESIYSILGKETLIKYRISKLNISSSVVAIIITTIVFALIHFDFEATDMVNELWNIPSYIVAGAILTLAYEHRGPACSMTAHVCYNIFAFLTILAS